MSGRRTARLHAVTVLVLLGIVGCARDAATATDPLPTTATTVPPATSAAPVPASAPAATTTVTTTSAPTAPPATDRPVVVIDPGHNGANGRHTAEIARTVDAGGFRKACNTTGTQGGDLTESAFNWQVAQRLRDDLVARGIDVVLTRTDDAGWGPCVDERGQVAARAGADLLISIHADGATPTGSGFHVIHPAPRPGYVDAGTATRSAHAATTVRDAPVAAGFTPSTYVGRNGLVERGDLGTLNRAGVTAVMIECGNMRNAADLARLRSPDGQAALADALATAIDEITGRSG